MAPMAHKFVLWFVNIFLIFRLSWQQENCKEPLGLADKNKIPDKSFSASSEFKRWYAAHYARLNGSGIWIAAQDVAGEYVQVDLGEMVVLTAVATQGRPGQTWAQFIEEYYVGYSSDGQNFTYLTDETGNVKLFQGHNEASINYLPSIYTRYFRLYASKWQRILCTQMELYGCKLRKNSKEEYVE